MSHELVGMFVPRLTRSGHKGSCGRIAVIGGSTDYTGAPYFAAKASLFMGTDLAHIFTHPNAATPIKSYSPDVIVSPSYDAFFPAASRFHAVVIGPGLGRDTEVIPTLLERTLKQCVQQTIPVIIDADALFFLPQCWEVLRGYPWAILTPNVVEFSRLCTDLRVSPPTAEGLAAVLQGPTLFLKGDRDRIVAGSCNESGGGDEWGPAEGSSRRVCGQGDVLC
eukprot:PhF_6_TR8535/c2_g1_i1/m.13380/K17757/CARKD; ATP-dependent NAD(P)H-hydrate dehydratase